MKSIAFLLALVMTASADWQPLWPGDAPGAPRPPVGSETVLDRGIIKNIEIPQYEIFEAPAEKRTGEAVLIFPGGGYSALAADHEGKQYAAWLTERGITGVVVKYRVSGDPKFGYQFPVPFLDARRAIRTVRANAPKWGVDPNKVGVMGSSAGGHLASLCATRFNDTFPEEGKDEIDKQECRPDFAILIYPVISMGPLAHTGSRFNLLGDKPTAEQIENYSTEKQVSKETPPVFLLTTPSTAATACSSPPPAKTRAYRPACIFSPRAVMVTACMARAMSPSGPRCWRNGWSKRSRMIRVFQHGDHVAIAEIFTSAIHQIASEVYTPEQCLAWSDKASNPEHWRKRCELKRPFVDVTADGQITGFLELDPDGHIDCAYINPKFARRGIMTRLAGHAMATAFTMKQERVYVEASICARPMFEKLGFATLAENQVDLGGVKLTNYRMERRAP